MAFVFCAVSPFFFGEIMMTKNQMQQQEQQSPQESTQSRECQEMHVNKRLLYVRRYDTIYII
jgi:hypothetical protein